MRLLKRVVILCSILIMLSIPMLSYATSLYDTPDTPVCKETAPSYDNDNDPVVRGCNTSWERATYPECCRRPYELLLQDEWYTGVDYAVPATRIFGIPCKK
jgi:hypothetical protein